MRDLLGELEARGQEEPFCSAEVQAEEPALIAGSSWLLFRITQYQQQVQSLGILQGHWLLLDLWSVSPSLFCPHPPRTFNTFLTNCFVLTVSLSLSLQAIKIDFYLPPRVLADKEQSPLKLQSGFSCLLVNCSVISGYLSDTLVSLLLPFLRHYSYLEVVDVTTQILSLGNQIVFNLILFHMA